MSSLKVLCLISCFILLFTTMSIVQSRVVYRPKHSWIARDIIVATLEEAQQHCESQGDDINDMYYWWDEEFRGIRDCVILAFTSKLITRFCNISDYEFICEKESAEAPTMTVVPSSAESKQTDDAPMTIVVPSSTEPRLTDAPTATVAPSSTEPKQTDAPTTTVAPSSTEPKQTDTPTTTVAPSSTEPKQTDTPTTTVAPSSTEPKQTDAPTTTVAPSSTEPKQTDTPTTTVAPSSTEPKQTDTPTTTVAPSSTEPKQTDAPTTTVAPASIEPKQTDTPTTTVAPSSTEPKQTDAPTTTVAPASIEPKQTDTPTTTVAPSSNEPKQTDAPTMTVAPASTEPTQTDVPVTVRDRASVPLDGTVDCGSAPSTHLIVNYFHLPTAVRYILKEISGVTKNDSDPVMYFIWIGVRKESETDNYRSVKGDDINDIYHRWDGRFLYYRDCAILEFTGELSTGFCSLSDYAFICEKESTDTLTMTAVQSPAEPKHTDAPTTTANEPTQKNVPVTVRDRTSVPLDGTVDCGSGYKLYAAGTCYKVHTKPEVSWDSANSTCSAEGGYIVVVNDKNEAKILKNIVGNFERSRYHVMAFFWVGIRWEPTANYYRSVKGDDINYIYFSHWYSDFHTDTKECALMDYDFYLRTKDCTDNFPYICEKEFN